MPIAQPVVHLSTYDAERLCDGMDCSLVLSITQRLATEAINGKTPHQARCSWLVSLTDLL